MQTWKEKLILASTLVFMWATAYAEFYQYTDANGVQRFTDDWAAVPAGQRGDAKTHASVKSEPVPPTPSEQATAANTPGTSSTPDATTPQEGTWSGRIAGQVEALDRRQVELNKIYLSLEKERESLLAKKPSAVDTAEAREAYSKAVAQLNAKIKDYETQYADFREKEKAFNDQYTR